MNAAGLIIMSLGLILIIIGVKGSQHNIINAIKGVHAPSQNSGNNPAPANGRTYPTPSTQPVTQVFNQ